MKKEIVPKDSRYIPLTQQRWCCAPTCIQMVMMRHEIPLVPAELIGYHLGLTVPPDETRYFWNVRTGPEPKDRGGYGTRIYERRYELNRALGRLKIPLQAILRLSDEFPTFQSFRNYLKDVEKKDKNAVVCFDHQTLFNSDYRGGHACLIDRVYLVSGKIRVIDPEYRAPKWRVVSLRKLYKAMRVHGPEKGGGFWEFNLKKK